MKPTAVLALLPLALLPAGAGSITIPETTRYLSLTGADFAPGVGTEVYTADSVPFVSAAVAWPPAAPCSAVAAVSLPHGATIQELKVRYFDSSGTHNADVLLRRHDLFGTTLPETLASAASSGTSGFQTRTDGSVQSPVVDNESFVYWIDLNSFQTPLGTLRLDGIVIEYTVTAPLP